MKFSKSLIEKKILYIVVGYRLFNFKSFRFNHIVTNYQNYLENSTVPLWYHTEKAFLPIGWRWFNPNRPTGLCIKKRTKNKKTKPKRNRVYKLSVWPRNGKFAGFPSHPPRPAPIGTGIGTCQSGMGRVWGFLKNSNRVRGGVGCSYNVTRPAPPRIGNYHFTPHL